MCFTRSTVDIVGVLIVPCRQFRGLMSSYKEPLVSTSHLCVTVCQFQHWLIWCMLVLLLEGGALECTYRLTSLPAPVHVAVICW